MLQKRAYVFNRDSALSMIFNIFEVQASIAMEFLPHGIHPWIHSTQYSVNSRFHYDGIGGILPTRNSSNMEFQPTQDSNIAGFHPWLDPV